MRIRVTMERAKDTKKYHSKIFYTYTLEFKIRNDFDVLGSLNNFWDTIKQCLYTKN
jgi:hypothetical protein